MGIFLRFLNCVNGTKSHKAAYKLYHRKRLQPKCYKRNAMKDFYRRINLFLQFEDCLYIFYIFVEKLY